MCSRGSSGDAAAFTGNDTKLCSSRFGAESYYGEDAASYVVDVASFFIYNRFTYVYVQIFIKGEPQVEPEQEKKKSPAGLIIAVILLLAALGALGYFGYNFYTEEAAKQELWAATEKARITPLPTSMVPTPEPTPEVTEEPTPTPTPTIAPEDMLPNDNLQSAFACMIRKSDGQVLLDKNMNDRMYPASMAKIMTTIIALENLPDLLAPEPQVFQRGFQ